MPDRELPHRLKLARVTEFNFQPLLFREIPNRGLNEPSSVALHPNQGHGGGKLSTVKPPVRPFEAGRAFAHGGFDPCPGRVRRMSVHPSAFQATGRSVHPP